jgi:hypothetical protein
VPLYEYECQNPDCAPDEHSHYEFDAMVNLAEYDEFPPCPRCGRINTVRKVIRTPHPKSQSWKA